MSAIEAIERAVHELAASVFESELEADLWLRAPNPVLHGKSPAEALFTPEGHRAVVNELKRIEYSRSDGVPDTLR